MSEDKLRLKTAATEKIYAVLLVRHPDNTAEVCFVVAPEGISEKVEELLQRYPHSKIRVYEKGYQADYFSNKDCMW